MRKLLLFLFVLPFCVWAQHPDDVRIINQLCSQEFSGRGYVNSGDSLAAEYIALEFKKLGLRPQKRSFFQGFGFRVNAFPGKLSFSINGNLLIPGKDYVVNPSSPSAKLDRETMVFLDKFSRVEDVVEALPQLDPAKHIIVLDKSKFISRDDQIVLRASIAKLSEVMPVILLNEGTPIWHVSQNQWNFPVFEVDKTVFQEGVIKAEIEAKIINHSARNVVARIKSKGKPRRRIVFTAHYDHLGRMGQNTFYPGANDNASGVTLMIAIARKNFVSFRGLQRNTFSLLLPVKKWVFWGLNFSFKIRCLT